MNLTLIGKQYLDSIYHISHFVQNETNHATSVSHQHGGMENLVNLHIQGLNINSISDGLKQAIIIEEDKHGVRSSITWDRIKTQNATFQETQNSDWVHVMYVDDIEKTERLLKLQPKMSVDFCTTTPREKFNDIINTSELVFDSRERKYLYKNIKTTTPIILHDPNGCEVLIDGQRVFDYKIQPEKNLSINGAGDVFAAFFIREYHRYNIEQATQTACVLTTNYLIEKDKS